MRFFQGKTLSQCGVELGITGSRVRQIQAKAIRTLRHGSQLQILKEVGCEPIYDVDFHAINQEKEPANKEAGLVKMSESLPENDLQKSAIVRWVKKAGATKLLEDLFGSLMVEEYEMRTRPYSFK